MILINSFSAIYRLDLKMIIVGFISFFSWRKSCWSRAASTGEKWTSWSAPSTRWRRRRRRRRRRRAKWTPLSCRRRRSRAAIWQRCARGRAPNSSSESSKQKPKWPTTPTSGIGHFFTNYFTISVQFYRILPDFTGFYRILPDFTGF